MLGALSLWLLRRFLALDPLEFFLLRPNWPRQSFFFLEVPSEAFMSWPDMKRVFFGMREYDVSRKVLKSSCSFSSLG